MARCVPKPRNGLLLIQTPCSYNVGRVQSTNTYKTTTMNARYSYHDQRLEVWADDVPKQTFENVEPNDWVTAWGHDGIPLYDVQYYDELDPDYPDDYGCQYVKVIEDDNGYYKNVGEWKSCDLELVNPTKEERY